jgi:hypothetical protein
MERKRGAKKQRARVGEKQKPDLTTETQRHRGMQYQGGGFGGLHTGCTPVALQLQFDEKVGRGADLERKRDC